jgi:SAM-dependent methyltransferase
LNGEIDLPYESKTKFSWSSLRVDEWDRFHGITVQQIPFVFSRQAQIEFFDCLDAFDDDSITVNGERYAVGSWLRPTRSVKEQEFWSEKYDAEAAPGWELGEPSPVLPVVIPQLKLVRSRILVLGCGSGHDAAYLAQAGHVVTAVDFSPSAIAEARKNYGLLENLKFVEADIFKLPEKWHGQFDIIFEHTCFCAISPDMRNDLVKVWRQMLNLHGHLLSVFYVMNLREGPPFGASEWEIRERLRKGFDFLYWTRWHQSLDRRKSAELVVYAKIKS